MRWRWVVPLVGLAMTAFGSITSTARAQTASSFMCGAALLSPVTDESAGNATALAEVPADVDGDGVLDHLTGDGVYVTVTYGGPAATALGPARFGQSGQTTLLLTARDLDGDGRAELVVSQGNVVQIVKADATGALRASASTTLSSLSSDNLAAWAGHFRSKGAIDLLLAEDDGTLSLYAVSSTSLTKVSGLAALMASTLSSPLSLAAAVADMDGDGLDDVVFPADYGVSMARLGSRSTWDVYQTLTLPQGRSRYVSASLGDFDGDGRRDLLIQPADAGTEPSPLNTWLQTATGDFTPIADVAAGSWTWGTPVLVGDLNGDGKDDFVAKAYVGHLVSDAWVIAPFGVQVPIDLVDWDGDGLLDYTAEASDLHLLHAEAARADLGIAVGAVPASVDAAGPVTATFVITNAGPTATRGLSLATTLSGGRFTIPGCADPSMGCTDLLLDVSQSVTVTLTGTAPLASGSFEVSVCSGAPDPVAANDTVDALLDVIDVVDLGVLAGGQFNQGSFTAFARAGNSGPSTAQSVTLSVTLPPTSSVAHVTPDPATASCKANGTIVTCTLDALAPQALLSVTLDGGFSYTGQALSLTATVTSATKEKKPSDNTFTLSLPALSGLPGSNPLGGPTAGPSGSGCGCALGADGARSSLTALAALALAACWTCRRRPRARGGRLSTGLPGTDTRLRRWYPPLL